MQQIYVNGKRIFLFLILCVSLSHQGIGQGFLPPAYNLTADTAAYTTLPDSCWQMMADPGGKLTLQQALFSDRFQDTGRTLNYREHVYWLRYRLVNSMRKEVKIALPEAAAYADIYAKTGSGTWQHTQTGTAVHWSKRDGLKRIPAVTLTIPAGETLTVYKRMYWDYVDAQPDSISVYFSFTDKLIQRDYVNDESSFMTSIQDAFLLALFLLSMIISLYYFIIVREKEFLYFSLYFFVAIFDALSSLNDVFLREYPHFLLYMSIFSSCILPFLLIHSLRQFLKTFTRFPWWDKFLIVFSFLFVILVIATNFTSAVLQTNLATPSHFAYNFLMLLSGVVLLITLFLFVREHDRAIRLMIIALTPVVCLKVLAYVLALVYHFYTPRFGTPGLNGYVISFNKAAFFILILCMLWMVIFFNWVLFLRFYHIKKELAQHSMLDKLKSRFFANISHEFRTPLTLIMGPLEDLIKDGDTVKFKNILPEIYRNSNRLLRLINQLLDLAKLDSNHYQINTLREDIIPFTKQIVASFHSLAQRKNISLEMDVDPALGEALTNETLHFYFDDDIVEKILSNLLANAFKFTPDGGRITVTMGPAEAKKGFLELKVADNGTGIPADKVPYIFDRFYQVDDSDKRRHGGSGIGLALLKELVELHQGAISVTSEVGAGTVFYCCLPLNKKTITDPKAAAGGEKESQVPDIISGEETLQELGTTLRTDKPLVLIVEDQEDLRKYIHLKLQDQYEAVEAVNGKEGLEKAFEEIPDLVITDVMMPEMDGFELCQALKTDNRTSHIPVILLTARAEDTDKLTGLETGADAYLIKPFNSRELLVRLHNLIEIRNRMRAKFSERLTVKPAEVTVTSQDRLLMERLMAVMETHMGDERFSVNDLGREVNMSVSQINRKLKAIINQTASQFIRAVRMQRALDLLKKDAGSIGDISYRVGFEDPGYFTKVFKNHFGCLPSERNKFPAQ